MAVQMAVQMAVPVWPSFQLYETICPDGCPDVCPNACQRNNLSVVVYVRRHFLTYVCQPVVAMGYEFRVWRAEHESAVEKQQALRELMKSARTVRELAGRARIKKSPNFAETFNFLFQTVRISSEGFPSSKEPLL